MSGSIIKCPDLFLNARIRSLIVLICSQMPESVPTCLDPLPNVRIHIAFVPVLPDWDECDMDSVTETLAKLKVFVIGHCFLHAGSRRTPLSIALELRGLA
jgi:hypothetical protein